MLTARVALIVFALAAAACHAKPAEASAPARGRTPSAPAPAPARKVAPAPAPVAGDRTDGAVSIHGTIEAIRMHNINKALGHYTYNVEIELRHGGVSRAGAFDPTKVENPLTVRVEKVFWTSLSKSEQLAVAPDGPQQELRPTRWDGLQVGDAIDLAVTFTSPSLAHRAQ